MTDDDLPIFLRRPGRPEPADAVPGPEPADAVTPRERIGTPVVEPDLLNAAGGLRVGHFLWRLLSLW